MKTETIELIGGYTDKDGVTHKEVEFGKRLTAQDVMNLDTDPQARIATNYRDSIRRQMITKFGTLKTPVALKVFSSLDSIDRDDLESAGDRFLAATREERTADFRGDFTVKLMFGFEIDEVVYNVVQFGNRITGADDIEADLLSLRGVVRDCFLIGRQISKISSQDGAFSIDGKVDLETFFTVDAEDIDLLKVGAEIFRQSFRAKGKELQKLSDGAKGGDSGAGNEVDGNGNSDNAVNEN